MENERPLKRPRTSTHDVFHDPVPVFQDYNMIVSMEGRVVRRGNTVLATSSIQTQPALGVWENVEAWEPVDDNEYALDPDGEWYDEALEADVMLLPVPKVKNKRSKRSVRSSAHSPLFLLADRQNQPQKRPHVVWMENHCQSYLDEIVRSAGRGDFRSEACPDCKARGRETPNMPEFRCEDYFIPDLVCQSCCVKRHRLQPLHWIQVLYFSCLFLHG